MVRNWTKKSFLAILCILGFEVAKADPQYYIMYSSNVGPKFRIYDERGIFTCDVLLADAYTAGIVLISYQQKWWFVKEVPGAADILKDCGSHPTNNLYPSMNKLPPLLVDVPQATVVWEDDEFKLIEKSLVKAGQEHYCIVRINGDSGNKPTNVAPSNKHKAAPKVRPRKKEARRDEPYVELSRNPGRRDKKQRRSQRLANKRKAADQGRDREEKTARLEGPLTGDAMEESTLVEAVFEAALDVDAVMAEASKSPEGDFYEPFEPTEASYVQGDTDIFGFDPMDRGDQTKSDTLLEALMMNPSLEGPSMFQLLSTPE